MRMAVRHQKSWPFASKVRGRSPPKFVVVRHQSLWPFATKARGRSPSKFVAVRHDISFGRSLKTRASIRVAVHLVRTPPC